MVEYRALSPQIFLALILASKAKLAAEWRRERELQIKELQKKQESMSVVNVVAKIGTPDVSLFILHFFPNSLAEVVACDGRLLFDLSHKNVAVPLDEIRSVGTNILLFLTGR